MPTFATATLGLKWLIWDGRRWAPDAKGRIVGLAKDTVRSLYELIGTLENDDRRQQFAAFVNRSERMDRLHAMISLCRDEVPILPDALDRDPWLLNCPNGILDLRTGDLRPHRQEDYLTKICPAAFHPDATSCRFDQFLHSVFAGNALLIDFVRRLCGYFLTGVVSEDLLTIFWGEGSNGKTTLINAFMSTFGDDYAAPGVSDMLMQRHNSQHPTDRADLFGRRFVPCTESADGQRFNEALIKSLTGRDTVKARYCHKDFFAFQPTHKILLTTNHLPKIAGTDRAIWRRIALVPFRKKFWDPARGETGPDGLRVDKSLESALRDEAEGILAWAVRGCREWQREGLGMASDVLGATKEYRRDQDVFGRFVEERCVTGDGQRATFAEVDAAFENWCGGTGCDLPSKTATGRELAQRFRRDGSSRNRAYVGIGVASGD